MSFSVYFMGVRSKTGMARSGQQMPRARCHVLSRFRMLASASLRQVRQHPIAPWIIGAQMARFQSPEGPHCIERAR